MRRIGFTSFDNPTPEPLTVPEILAAMSGQQKLLVLEGFTKGIPFGTYKDQVDASSGAFNLLAAKKEVKIIR